MQIFVGKIPITVCNVHLHHNDNITVIVIKLLIEQLRGQFIITGDFNAHIPLWGPYKTCSRKQLIEKIIHQESLILSNNGASTHFNIYNGTLIHIDLTACSPTLASTVQWSTNNELYSGARCPQIIDLSICHKTQTESVKWWIIKKADEEKYRARTIFPMTLNYKNFDDFADNITNTIFKKCCKIHFNNKEPNQHKSKVCTMGEQRLCSSNRLKNKCLARYRRTSTSDNLTLLKIAWAKARRVKLETKRKIFQTFASLINSHTSAVEVFNKVKRI